MKTFRFIYQFVLLLMCTTACNEYDDSELWDRVNSLDDRVTSIENQLKALNNDITSISALVGALQNRLYLTNVTTLEMAIHSHFQMVRISRFQMEKMGLMEKMLP